MPSIQRIVLAAAIALVPFATIPVHAANSNSTTSAVAHPVTAPPQRPETPTPGALAAAFSTIPPSRLASPFTRPGSGEGQGGGRVSPRSQTGSFVTDGGFETETTTPAWTQSSNGGRQLVDTVHPHTGLYSADLCQNTNSCSDAVIQSFTVPAVVMSASLTFWHQLQTTDSTAQPSPCNDFMGAGIADYLYHVTAASAVKFCEDWGTLNGYAAYTIDETSFLQAHQGQLVNIEGVGYTDPSGPSRFFFDDYSLTITYATAPAQPQGLLAEPDNSAVTLKWQPPSDDGGAAVTAYQVSVFKNGVANVNLTFNSPTTTEVVTNLTNGAPYTFQVAARNLAGSGPLSALSNSVIPSPTYPAVAVSDRQYSLANNDGSTWVDMDPTYLVASVTPILDSQALISANADLWTATAGVNQDIGVAISGGAYPTASGQPEAWKESGGYAGTYSPNAAFVHTVRLLHAGTTYTIKVQWKANKSVAGSTIFAGAGPIGPDFSPTRLSVVLVPDASANVATAASSSQFTLAGSDGSTWRDLGPSADPTVTFTAPAAGTIVASGNADLWTANAGFNQDLGITVSGGTGVGTTYPTTAGQPEAWKESGGFAGTFSPNAAFVQAVLPVASGSQYTLKLQWKTNRSGASTIVAGAGPINGQFSSTRLTVWFIPATGPITVQDAAVNTQPQLPANDGVNWADMDSANLSLSITKTSNCVALLTGNADLWTARAGYNQDVGVQVAPLSADRTGWKESGGFAGTYSPNAAFVQTMFPIGANTTYTAKLQWKANKNAPATTVFAGAGPIGSKFSPTRLTAIVFCVPPPVITSISPTSGYTGTLITINGTNLTGATVNFGTQAASVQTAGDTQMLVFPPKQTPGTVVDVTATTSGGTSPTVPADRFTYSYSGAILADSPNIYYRLGESAGPAARDISGNNHNGVYAATGVTYGVAGALASDPDTAITLDGVAGNLQEASGAGVPAGSASRSIEVWFKTTVGTEMPIVSYGTPGTASELFGVYLNGTSIEVKTGAGTVINFPSVPATALNDGKWHHLVVTYTSGAPSGNLVAYLDGANFGTQTPSGILNTVIDSTGLLIGEDNAATPAFFNGSLDEVAVYSGILATYQVSNHYKAGTGT